MTFRVDSRTRFSCAPIYDAGVTQVLMATLKPRDECWNIGANVGVHVLQMCSRVGPTGQIVAFEPNPYAAALLQRNVTLDAYSGRVSIVQAAIGEYIGTTEFYIAGSDPMGRPQRPNPLLHRTTCLQVPVFTLDHLLAQRGRSPRCLVMDIEGWEIGALLGAQGLLQLEPLPLLIVELHPDAWSWSGHSREQLVHLMESSKLERALAHAVTYLEDLDRAPVAAPATLAELCARLACATGRRPTPMSTALLLRSNRC